ncbi:CBASS oligonucleotide cyclase [Marinobacter sp. 3-2]|uniref:CBASS oligonucleotide cyclase n=1 Tax=Marinobacter sp. 3-2 TaxID=2485141 RepID=UPI001C62CACF|nr:CBASS oligonucleotide cyclase [Marinobacter sp. 3-2]
MMKLVQNTERKVSLLRYVMSRNHVDHKDLARFAQEKVNLPKAKADEYRAQARRLREKLNGYLGEHPDFTLRKMLISGSLAKGTALRSLNDIDVACYVSGTNAPSDIPKLLEYLAEKLRKAFPNFSPDQVKPQTYSITISFRGSGLDVDIVPILYFGDENWYGDLISQDDGSFLKTSIPRHLEFAQKRKDAQPQHFTQVVRLIKFWAKKEKRERNGFRFKSFMIEMILAKLVDEGTDLSNYPEALQSFFTYIAMTGMRKEIIFSDYYPKSDVGIIQSPIKIIDPVNPENNVARLYNEHQADLIVDAALEAGDAIDAALTATTKQDTMYYWQKVFGSSFQM